MRKANGPSNKVTIVAVLLNNYYDVLTAVASVVLMIVINIHTASSMTVELDLRPR